MSYVPYRFTVVVSGNQLVFTFALPTIPATQLQITNPWYINVYNMTMKIDRFNQNLVHFGDDKGVITVDFTLSTSPSPAGGLAAWIALVTNMLPVNQITNQYTAVRKSNVQNVLSGADAAVVFNGLDNVGTDVSYNSGTGLFTVNVTGIYQTDGLLGLGASVGGAGVYYYIQRGVTTLKAAFLFNTSYNSFGGAIFFTAGETFTVRIQNGSGVTVTPISGIGGITTQFTIVRVGQA